MDLLRVMVGNTELAKRLVLVAPSLAACIAAEQGGQGVQLEQLTISKRNTATHNIAIRANIISAMSQRDLNRAQRG